MKMLRFILTLMMLGVAASGTLAYERTPYESRESYKDMAAKQLYIYGQTLYDRKDYVQASQVFRHIVEINPELLLTKPYIVKAPEPKAVLPTCCDIQAPVITPIAALRTQDYSMLDPDIRTEIAIQDVAIKQLKQELAQLKSQPEIVSYE
jgi:hypothetical protein